MQKATSSFVDVLLKWVVLPIILVTLLVSLANGGTFGSLSAQTTVALVGVETDLRILLAAAGGLFFLVGAAHLVWPSKHSHAWAQMGGSAGLIVIAWLFPEIMLLLATLANSYGPMALGGLQSAASGHAAAAPAASPAGGTMPLPHQ